MVAIYAGTAKSSLQDEIQSQDYFGAKSLKSIYSWVLFYFYFLIFIFFSTLQNQQLPEVRARGRRNGAWSYHNQFSSRPSPHEDPGHMCACTLGCISRRWGWDLSPGRPSLLYLHCTGPDCCSAGLTLWSVFCSVLFLSNMHFPMHFLKSLIYFIYMSSLGK